MPPRHSYWTILLDGTATSFRAATQEELVPTLHQLRRKDPAATLKWFARGRLWDSPIEARAAASQRPRARQGDATRDRDWRPGGTHRDPRARVAKTGKGRKKASARPRKKG
jgi:hypothetical protein